MLITLLISLLSFCISAGLSRLSKNRKCGLTKTFSYTTTTTTTISI